METLTVIVVSALGLLALRRLLLAVAAVLPRATIGQGRDDLRIAVVASLRNEESGVAGLLDGLDGLTMDRDQMSVVLVDDASSDGTGDLLESWARGRENARCLRLEEPVGKAGALNRGVAAAGDCELVAVYDADQRPRPGSLGLLAAAFHDPRVGAASGYRRPVNAGASLVALGAAAECLAHQLVVQSGRDRLGLDPPTMGGNCAYRASALAEIGGFPEGSAGEDVEVSLALVAAGWRTRFVVGAVADSRVADTLRQYWTQRVRWGRSLYGASRHAALRAESWMVVLGYADRLVVAAALALSLLGYMSLLWPVLYLCVPGLTVVIALARSGELRLAPRYGLALVALLPFELATTAAATLASILRRPLRW